MGSGDVPLYTRSRDPWREAHRESRRQARLTRRWNEEGPRAFERWAYRAPWRPAALSALMVGSVVGRTFRRWAEPSIGVFSETPWAVARTLIVVTLAVLGWIRLREHVALYAEWSREPPVEVAPSRWLIVAITGLAAALLPAFVSLPERSAAPPDGEAIGRAVAGATGGFELIDGHLEATDARELSLVEEGLERWYVATRDADGDCFGLVYTGGTHDRTEPLAGPCTGEEAGRALD